MNANWSRWGVRLVALVTIATSISLAFIWIEQFYRGVQVNSIIVFRAADAPWMPTGTNAVPVIGVHYFGDFQLPYGWALNIREGLSPYLSSAIPANYDPFVIVSLIPFTILSMKTATVLFLLMSAFIFLFPLWLLLSPLRTPYRLLILGPLAIVTTPLATMLDRGNIIGVAIGCCAAALVAWRNERWLWCGIFLAAAIALKGYPAALLVVPLALRRYRFTLLVAFSALALNLAALAIIPGGYVRNLRAAIPAMTSLRLVSGSQMQFWGLYSLIPKVVGLLTGPAHLAYLLNPGRIVVDIPSVIYLVLLYIVIRSNRVPQWCWGSLSLACIQLIGPVGGTYTTGWACAAALWFAWGSFLPEGAIRKSSNSDSEDDLLLRILLMLAITASLTPSVFSVFGIDQFGVPANDLLSPALLFVTLCVAVVKSLLPRRAQVTFEGSSQSTGAREQLTALR
jgi:hypothetical protein